MGASGILVPVDFSEPSHAALREADALALERGSTLLVLNVQPLTTVAVLDFTYTPQPESVRGLLDAAETQLAQWKSTLRTPPERVRTEVVLGDPGAEIVRRSADHDLVVMATHGRTGVSRVLMGSVAERVVRLAQCSVLVVRPSRGSRGDRAGTAL